MTSEKSAIRLVAFLLPFVALSPCVVGFNQSGVLVWRIGDGVTTNRFGEVADCFLVVALLRLGLPSPMICQFSTGIELLRVLLNRFREVCDAVVKALPIFVVLAGTIVLSLLGLARDGIPET